jgi:acyl-CoA synthetase (AMP-forming)/AMP-acid ligase II
VAARAAECEAAGLGRGERVFVLYANTLEFFVDLLAVWRLGACAVPLDPRLTPFAVANLARTARPRLAIVDDDSSPETAAALFDLGVRCMEKPARTHDADAVLRPAGLDPDDEALILFTSGTTGDPKGVVHTHRSLGARWDALARVLDVRVFRRTLCLLPTYFGHGLICNCLFPWLRGQDLYVLPPFRGDLVAQLGQVVDAHRITFLSSVPTVWRLATKTSARPERGSLEHVVCGSAPLSAALWRSVQDWAGTTAVLNAYGITETGSWLAGTSLPSIAPEDGLIGEPWGSELRILRTADTAVDPDAERCVPGESGLVWVRTPALMKGYLDRADLTARVVKNGWLSTGDVGAIDARGRLYLQGREREEINKAGMKIHPAEIDAIIERFPAAVDVCAFGVDDPLLGEDVAVAIVLDAADGNALARAQQWTAAHLASHQMPRKWFVLDAIPRTSRGKINRAQVAELCRNRAPATSGGIGNRSRAPR